MKPTHHITPPAWMTSAAAQTVMAALNDAPMQALFVGGSVRNALLGAPVSDIDIATIHAPDDVFSRLNKAQIKAFPTGIEHGTVTAVQNGQHFEITTLRRDVATDGRRAVVAFTTDWAEDAQRRDFTMNTLLADTQGNIYDPLGNGVADALAGRVIFVGNPAARIAEDYLRIMRFFRFHALYGKGEPDQAALQACEDAADHIKTLSRERITQETLKILAVKNPAPTLSLMFAHKVALFLRGDQFNTAHFERFCSLQNQHNESDVVARLAVLMSFEITRIEHLAPSNAQAKTIRDLAALTHEKPALDAHKLRDMVFEHGNALTTQYLLWESACGAGDVDAEALSIAQTFSPPKFPLTGQDLIHLGIKPGRQMGQMLADVQAWWRSQGFQPDYQQCLAQLRQLQSERQI